jgi:hypothetical protein
MHSQPSTLIASTLLALENSGGQADYQRIAGDILKYATPREIESLVMQVTAPSPFRNWLRDTYALVTRHRAAPAAYDCDYASPGISRYSGGDSARTVVVIFCGKAQILAGPTASVLQYFPPEAFDILVLRDPALQGFTTGVTGFADSFTGLIDRLRSSFDLDRYEEIRCMGGSSGSAAALAAGQLLGASRLVSFGGRPPSQSVSHGNTADAEELERLISGGPDGAGRAFAVFGADNAEDSAAAQALSKLLSLTLVPLAGIADHSTIGALHRTGGLSATLQEVGLL